MLALFFIFLASAAVSPGQRQQLATPPPTVGAAPDTGLGYFLMLGNQIISPPFANVSDCYKSLAKLKGSMQPGVNTVVCVHRRP
jgi:hypothetical protein